MISAVKVPWSLISVENGNAILHRDLRVVSREVRSCSELTPLPDNTTLVNVIHERPVSSTPLSIDADLPKSLSGPGGPR